MENRISGFPPVADENSRILILGSMPSVKSLETGFYYGHKQNAFWYILSTAFDCPLPETVSDKKRLLTDHRVALWDVISSCEREGSLDSAIRNQTPNDLSRFFQTYPQIRAVLLNGGTAAKLFPKETAQDREILKMPSTSPAYTLPRSEKLKIWTQALHRLLKEDEK